MRSQSASLHDTHFSSLLAQDMSLRLWNLTTRVCVLNLSGEGGHRNEVLTVVRPARPCAC